MKGHLVRIAFYLATPAIRLYRLIFRPGGRAAACLIRNQGEILLVRNTYGERSWTLPGGAARKKESPEEAVRREVLEEVGINLKTLEFLGDYFTDRRKNIALFYFFAEVPEREFKLNGWEILQGGWFPENDLPQPLAESVPRILEMYRSRAR